MLDSEIRSVQCFKNPPAVYYARKPKLVVENYRYANPPLKYQRRGKELQPTAAANNSLPIVAQGRTLSNLASISIPSNRHKAILHDEWYKAMEEEITAVNKNGIWTLTDLPVSKKAVGCKWVYALKFKTDGSTDRYIARLVEDLLKPRVWIMSQHFLQLQN